MSLIRLSVLEDRVYVPTPVGQLYDKGKLVGIELQQLRGGILAEKGKPFWDRLTEEIVAKTKGLTKDSPLVVMVHGFGFFPKDAVPVNDQGFLDADRCHESKNPHSRIFHFEKGGKGQHWRHSRSWLLGLEFTAADYTGKDGLALAFGWNSEPDVFNDPVAAAAAVIKIGMKWQLFTELADALARDDAESTEKALLLLKKAAPKLYAQAYERAIQSAWVLVNTLRVIAAVKPDHPIDLFCHSLGARVVIQAILQLATNDQTKGVVNRLGRVVILGGAEYADGARTMLAAVDKVRPPHGPQFYNFMVDGDQVLDVIAEKCDPLEKGKDSKSIGRFGLYQIGINHRWINLQLDKLRVNNIIEFVKMHYDIDVAGSHPCGVANHWYYFTNEENLKLFDLIFRKRDAWTINGLRMRHIPEDLPAPAK